ncbi:NF038129 family PEP-CTERM protein [Telluria beijingensis]|uniref:NF038129 family PEP-CTERM protein n=1 Tax=Telluria beijingensis TaxID=3068633 RepID=UPI002795234E|nr:NF038129 family PEP-CTERM protein [Massilia sp. REN29]
MPNLYAVPVARILARAFLAVLLASGASASATTLHVEIDTSRFGVASGYLDLQLSATAGVSLATVVLSNMSGFGSVVESWGVTPIPGGGVFRNDTANDLFHAVDFGGVLSFDLHFSGDPDPLMNYVSRFVVSAFDEAYNLLGGHDPLSGALVAFGWTPATDVLGRGAVDVQLWDPAVTVVPEPANWQLLAAGVLALGGARLSRRRQRLAERRASLPA